MTAPGLPEPLARFLDGARLEDKIGSAVLLAVNGPDGTPHTALLSVGEILAVAPDRMAVALYPSSRTSLALRSQHQALLLVVADQKAYKVRLAVDEVVEPSEQQPLVRFLARIAEVREDAVGYATVTQGVQFVLPEPDRVLLRWRTTIEQLRDLAGRRPTE